MCPNEGGSLPSGRNEVPLKLLVASEIRFVRESIGEVLGRGGLNTVLGYCADLDQTLSMTSALRPDMVLLDAALKDGALAVRRLRQMILGLHVVVFAVKECVESVLVWAEAGVAGYIPSTAAMAEFQALLADVRAGRQTCSPLVAAGLLQRVASAALGTMQHKKATPVLNPRELEIVRLIGGGLSNKEIARYLNIGLATTKSRVHNVLGKPNLQRREQAASWMQAHSPPSGNPPAHHLCSFGWIAPPREHPRMRSRKWGREAVRCRISALLP